MKLGKTLKHLFHPQRSNNHRPKLLHPKPLIFMSLIAVGFFQMFHLVISLNLPQGNILGYASNITVAQIIEGTNNERAKQGLVALTYNQQLSEAAAGKAQDMFNEQYWAHTSPSGKEPWDFIKNVGYSYRVAGENLARDFDSTAPMISAWMNSPTHRANIMNSRYRDIGLAVVDGKLNGVETTLVVQMFGAQSTSSNDSQPSVDVPAAALVVPDAQQAETPTSVPTTPTPVVEPTPGTQLTPIIDTPVERNLPLTEEELLELSSPDQATQEIVQEDGVLARARVPQGTLSEGILFSPLHLMKAFFLSMIFLILAVLAYDSFVIGHKKTVRLVGKNLAHIILFIFVAYLVVFFKGGVI